MEYKSFIYIAEFGVGGIIKVIFLFFALYSYCVNKEIGHFLRTKYKWSNSFFVKMTLNFWLCMNYAAMALYFFDIFSFLFLNSLVWLVSCSLLYFEYIRKIPHRWVGLRTFWLLNGLLYIIKIIIVFVLIILNKEDAEVNLCKRLMFFYIIQGIPSIFLLIFSIFYNDDNTENSILKIADEISQEINSNFVSNGANSIELNISEIKSNKYIRNDNGVLIPVNENEFLPDKIKLRFNIKIGNERTYLVKKSLTEIIEFNYNIYAKFKSDYNMNINATIIIQLKNLTSIFSKKSPTESKLRELELVYINLCSLYVNFIDDFLMFCEINDDEVKEFLKNNLKSELRISATSSSHSSSTNNLDQKAFSIDSKEIRSCDDINLKVKGLMIESNDIFKMIIYISSIIISHKPVITFKVDELKEKPQLIESTVKCVVLYEEEKKEIEIHLKALLTFLKEDKKISQASKAVEMKKFIKNSNNVMKLKNKQSNESKQFGLMLTNMINDIFYLNEISFTIFDLNKIVNLDNEEIDMDIVNSFFELENVAYENTPFINSLYDKITDIQITLANEEVNVSSAVNIKLEKISTNKIWNSTIDLKQLLQFCNEIVSMNNNFRRFHSLNGLLSSIIDTVNKILEENANETHFNELIKLFNELFVKENLYVFFSLYFREAFLIGEYTENKEDNQNDQLSQLNKSNNQNSLDNSMLENLLS